MAFFKRCRGQRLKFLALSPTASKKCLALSVAALKIFNRCRLQRFQFVADVGDIDSIF
jgi:hypothetical protein